MSTSNCMICKKEIEFLGFEVPTLCEECDKKYIWAGAGYKVKKQDKIIAKVIHTYFSDLEKNINKIGYENILNIIPKDNSFVIIYGVKTSNESN